ncbi:hypothetical protein EXT67_20440 [Pectobacterium atrosepticum]|uniref:Uncharacterized protein n=1 Tax=Pectobacterium phage phiTE TaxID=1116482 RepID=K9L550_9CAUD|nr:hypothetical protein [Pectobacterium atrosepticum]YP_007392571.1 superinfection exclusion [Pectobacterium phage phiTE]AEZ66275.1 hypothetical protein phiTE_109 [Pectobacterium phage phiTE]MCL6318675.1 hypothetical protein [Pectobacterium atrosepticum]
MKQKLRVCHVPQIPMEPFIVPVSSLEEAVVVMNALADYDLFQFENKIKPDYCNMTVPDELTERLFSMRQQAILDGSYTETGEWENLVCDVLKARDACRAAMIKSGSKDDL